MSPCVGYLLSWGFFKNYFLPARSFIDHFQDAQEKHLDLITVRGNFPRFDCRCAGPSPLLVQGSDVDCLLMGSAIYKKKMLISE